MLSKWQVLFIQFTLWTEVMLLQTSGVQTASAFVSNLHFIFICTYFLTNFKVNKTKSQNAVGHFIKGFFKYLTDRFPYPFIYLNLWNPYPFIYLKPKKSTPFGVEPPHIGHYREYPRALLYNYIVCIFVPLNLGVHGDAASVYFFMAVTCTESASIQKLVIFCVRSFP